MNSLQEKINKIRNLCEKWNTKYSQYYEALTGIKPYSKIKLSKTSFADYFALDFVGGTRIWVGKIDEIQRYVSIMLRDFGFLESRNYILYSPKRYKKELLQTA